MNGFSGEWFRGGGLVVALVGFGVTRLFVAETLQTGASTPFVIVGVLSLVVGLGLTVYGVVLAVGPFSREYVGVVARWCLLGTAGMSLVLGLSSLDSLLSVGSLSVVSESPTLAANVMLGGAIGGVLVGTRSARNRRDRREIKRNRNRAKLINRLLRHEVINAATIVRGYAEHLDPADDRDVPTEPIGQEAQRIVDTIDDVGEITADENGAGETDVAAIVETEMETFPEQFPEMTVRYDGPAEGVVVQVGGRLDVAVRNLLEYAVDVADAGEVTVEITDGDDKVILSVTHDGRELPDPQHRLLTDGEFPEHDDPTTGFRLGIVRLLVTQANGRIRTSEEDSRTTLHVELPRRDTVPDVARAVAVTGPNLGRAALAGVIAGVVMGGYVQATSDTISVIGALYGVDSEFVGWTTHLFHSVVFAVLFAAGRSRDWGRRISRGITGSIASGLAWGATLWLFAAGVLMPVWLQFVGVPTVLPNFSFPGLVSHLLWGGVLGLSYAFLTVDWRLGDRDP